MTVPCGRSARSAQVQALGAGAGLEHELGAAPAGPVPAGLGVPPGLLLRQRLEAEAAGDAAAPGRGLGDQHLGTGAAGEERGEEPDRAAAPDDDRAALDPGAEAGTAAPKASASAWRMPLAQIGPIWATRMPRIGSSAGGSVSDEIARGVRGVAGLVAEGGGDEIAGGEARRARSRSTSADFHVAEERHREAGRGLAGIEDAARLVPAGVQVGVGAPSGR